MAKKIFGFITPHWLYACLGLIVLGCMPKVNAIPVTTYPVNGKYDLSIGLNTPREMCIAKWSLNPDQTAGMEFELGDDFCNNVEALANALFVNVHKIDNTGAYENQNLDATLTPRIVTLILNRPPSASGEQITTLIVEWSLKDINGDIVWIDTIKADGKNKLNKLQEQAEAVFNDLFNQSYEAMAYSIEIARFAKSKETLESNRPMGAFGDRS